MALGSTITQVTDSGLKPGITFPSFVSSGVATATNFKTGTTNVHSTGIEAGGINVNGGDTKIGTGATVWKDGGALFSGIVTATSFVGDISNATGAAAGLGTALSQTQTNPLNKIYYTDSILSVGSTITINPPSSASAAYTQYTDIVADGADIIVADGDDFIPDVLGISTDTIPSYSGSGGRVRAGKFTNTGANGAPTAPNGWIVTGVSTATTFKGNLIGNVTGTASQLETNATGANLTLSGNLGVGGTLTYEDVTRVDAVGLSTFREGLEVGPLAGIALTAYKDGSIRTTGVITATTYYGSGAQLTGIDASALKSGGSVKVQANSHGAVTTGVMTATSFAGSGANLTNLPASGKGTNLMINGAMQICQRYGTSAHVIGANPSFSGYVLDRWLYQNASTNEAPTVQQVDVAADTPAWNAGFRKSSRITNGNQTSGAQAASTVLMAYNFEAQDLAQSGWDYTSASDYVTLSFWVKSSVAQDFPFYWRSRDGTNRMYSMMTGSLNANTWTKITKTIPGDPGGLTIDNNTGPGMQFLIAPYYGTDGTASGSTLNAWKAWSSSSRWEDITTTWFTTNDATFEVTGFKVEVGSSATDFDHKSYADDLFACQRNFQMWKGENCGNFAGRWNGGSDFVFAVPLARPLMKSPTAITCKANDTSGSANGTWKVFRTDGSSTGTNIPTVRSWTENTPQILMNLNGLSGGTDDRVGSIQATLSASGWFSLAADV